MTTSRRGHGTARPRHRWSGLTVLTAIVVLSIAAQPMDAAQGPPPRASASAATDDVVTAAARGLIVSAFAAPYLGSARVATVLVGVEGALQRDGQPDAVVDVSVNVRGPGTRSEPRTASVPVGSASDGRRAAPYLTELELPPGRHDILISTWHLEGAGPGITLPVDVPSPAPPGTTGFSMSPIVLASSTSPAAPHGDASDDRRVLPILVRPPSPTRAYHADEQVELFAEIYDWESEPGQELQYTVTTTVRDATGESAFVLEELGVSEPLSSGRYGFVQSTLIPVHRLAPGPYTVELGAQSLTDPAVRASRSAAFRVVEAVAPPAP